MQVLTTVEEVLKTLDAQRHKNPRVGLVLTMGALHEGHASLISRARMECDTVFTTIFVNPLQFDSNQDFNCYNRDLESDIKKAADLDVDYLFTPSPQEMYPSPFLTRVWVNKLSDILEGASRIGHFEGVTTVVGKFFAIFTPCRAYFGEKDYQQLVIIQHMARDIFPAIEVVACPTVRADDGLALSSRNIRLTYEQRSVATSIYKALTAGKNAIEQGERKAQAVELLLAGMLKDQPGLEVDYAQVRASDSLDLIDPLEGKVRLLAAVLISGIRLIDNIGVLIPDDNSSRYEQ
ncbi:MAG: pantoate--beta-alanine ligase [Actinobacteria bacterium]|jgi:pantoate--beta-alanine ligase|nr:pantoate--beta-alanine ligase [Actinomycetota bacterium]MCL6104934.1 pantoate--beta-alanine ligase [Actinomycetota bacterium]